MASIPGIPAIPDKSGIPSIYAGMSPVLLCGDLPTLGYVGAPTVGTPAPRVRLGGVCRNGTEPTPPVGGAPPAEYPGGRRGF